MAYGNFPDRFIQSRPHEVFWAGFRSNTFQLQQAGWEFAADQSYERDEIRMAMRHREFGMYGITSGIPGYMYADMHPNAPACFDVVRLTDREMKFHYVPNDIMTWLPEASPVDMRPTIQYETKDIEDFKIFACPLVRTNEVIVDPNSVPELMDRILELQDPARKEHFLQMAKESRQEGSIIRPGPQQNFHAQIVSLVA